MNQSENIEKLVDAMVKVQSCLRGALKDSTNPFFKSKYADLESVWEAARGPLTQNGLTVIQTMDTGAEGPCVVTTLAHLSGQWIRGSLPVMMSKKDPQSLGAAITYARRYSLAAIVGIIQVDDDAESVMGRAQIPAPKINNRLQILPQQPGEDEGVIPNEYRVPFGKFVKRSLDEIPIEELKGYVNYLETKAAKEGKEITGVVAEFISLASNHIGAFENGPMFR